MPFNVYNSVVMEHNSLGPESPAMSSRAFCLLERTKMTLEPGDRTGYEGFFNIRGIAKDVPQVSYSTSWSLGAAPSLANKVNDLFKNDLFKMMASSNSSYRPVLLTDGWTQQYPKEGAKLKVGLQFRSYPYEMYNTTDYFEIFKILFSCSAPRKFGFGDNITVLQDAIKQTAKKGLQVGDMIGNMLVDFNELRKKPGALSTTTLDQVMDVTKRLDAELAKLDTQADKLAKVETYDVELSKITDHKQRLIYEAAMLLTAVETITGSRETACPRFTFGYGNIFDIGGYDYWVISDWSCKPCVNTTIINGKICPIYIDFTINVQTAGKIGSNDLERILTVTSSNVVKRESKAGQAAAQNAN